MDNLIACGGRGTDAGYFDALYAQSDDPWKMESRWYERRKRALLSAMLLRERYVRAFEPGCGNGLFTEILAPRCDAVLAHDLNARAVAVARARVWKHGNAHVSISQAGLPEQWPEGEFDLIVVGELGYYFDASTWKIVAAALSARLTSDGTLLACHWKAPFEGRRLDTVSVHDALRMAGGLHAQCVHDESDFVAELWTREDTRLGVQKGLR